jgi:hypothetical protein
VIFARFTVCAILNEAAKWLQHSTASNHRTEGTRPMANVADITAAQLRAIFNYNPETGELFWKARTPDMFAEGSLGRAAVCKSWNTKFAGKKAFSDDRKGYYQTPLYGRVYRTHRIIWVLQTGQWPSEHIDHADGNGKNNRFGNLREATKAQNAFNAKTRVDSETGLKGAAPTKSKKKFVGYIRNSGRKTYLGTFNTPEEAHAAYVEAALETRGQFARGK